MRDLVVCVARRPIMLQSLPHCCSSASQQGPTNQAVVAVADGPACSHAKNCIGADHAPVMHVAEGITMGVQVPGAGAASTQHCELGSFYSTAQHEAQAGAG